MWKCFKVRPNKNSEDKFETNDKYCVYEEVHDDYVYTMEWVEFIQSLFLNYGFTTENFNSKTSENLLISDYSIN